MHLAPVAAAQHLVVVVVPAAPELLGRGQLPELEVPVRAFRYEPNRGKGYALKVGFANARGDRILFTDADLATPIEQLDQLSAAIDA